MDHFPFCIKRDIFFFLSIDNLKNDEYEKRMHPLSPQLSSKKRLLRFDFFFFFFKHSNTVATLSQSYFRDCYPNSGWFTASLKGMRGKGKSGFRTE